MPSSTALNAHAFAEKARKDLLSLLESVPGKKNLILQRSLVGPIELLVKFSTLQEYGVDRIFFLENNNADSSQRNVVFLARGEKPQQAQAVAEQIKRLQQSSTVDHDFSVFWVPRRSLLSRTILEEAGVLGDINIGEFPLYFQPLEDDLLSLELDDSFKELYHRKDPTCIFTAAQALMTIQDSCGLFPRLLGKGPHAQRLIELLLRIRGEDSSGEDSRLSSVPKISAIPSSEIDCLIVVDRSVDFISGLLTQLTYEGLIDENFGINHSQVELDNSITGLSSQSSTSPETNSTTPATTTSKRKVRLDSSDKLYVSLRDANFSIVGSLLNRVARRLQSDYTSRPDKNQTTAQLRDFVQKLPAYQAEQQSLKIHTSLAEEVLKRTRDDVFRKTLEVQQNLVAGLDPSNVHDMIEDLIARDAPLTSVLRLLCLESTTNGGLRQKDYERFSRDVVQAYGYRHLLTLDALGKMGLLIVRPASGAFNLTVPGMTMGMGMGMGLGGGSAATSSSSTTQTSLAATNYDALRRALNLVVDDVSEQDPTDIAYVYSGYAPLSVRLVQCLVQKPLVQSLTRGYAPSVATNGTASTGSDVSQGWRPFETLLQNVAGKTVDEAQTTSDRAARARGVLEGRGGRKTSVVFFLGGVTFAEVAALRFVGEQERETRRIVVATTSVISGERMVSAAVADLKP